MIVISYKKCDNKVLTQNTETLNVLTSHTSDDTLHKKVELHKFSYLSLPQQHLCSRQTRRLRCLYPIGMGWEVGSTLGQGSAVQGVHVNLTSFAKPTPYGQTTVSC
jgi:hypothetical protein